MPVLILLPLACFVLAVMALRRRLPALGFGEGPYAAMVLSAILLAGFAAAITEVLSIVEWLSFWPVTGCWLLLLGALLLRTRLDAELRPEERWDWKLPGADGWRSWGTCCWIATGVLVLLALLVAMASPPNTHDALSYHLPRQLRWIEMQQVRHYATDDMRELSFPPLAEYLQCHTMLLTSTDLLVNLPQWAAYALAVLA